MAAAKDRRAKGGDSGCARHATAQQHPATAKGDGGATGRRAAMPKGDGSQRRAAATQGGGTHGGHKVTSYSD